MFNKMVTPTDGSGDKVKRFTNITVGTETKSFDCGFKPKYIILVFGQTSSSISAGYVYEYDETVSTTNFSYTSDNKVWSNNAPIGVPSSGWTVTFSSVDSTGFGIFNRGTGGNVIIHTAIAIG